jgi:NAD(P)-dependent dehydrogenase (short-subunit alcohol dehydrogenase family)
MLLEDKVCVVVGAGSPRGIGYATARLFAEHGAKVVVADLAMDDDVTVGLARSVSETTGKGADIHGIECDIGKPSDCDRLIAETLERHGKLDALVNSAGIVRSQSALEIDDADLDRMLDVNLKGAFYLCRSALRHLSVHRGGTIVNIASVAAQRGGGLVGGAHYAASKGGVVSLTKSIAREFGPAGIRANVVCPSMTDTAMLDGNMSEEKYREIVETIPLKRAGNPRDIAGACLFLSSDLSAYITGATIDVNGGSHIH